MVNDIPSSPVVPTVLIEESKGNFVPMDCLSSGSDSQVVKFYCNDNREVLITEKKVKKSKKNKNSENSKKIRNSTNTKKSYILKTLNNKLKIL